MPIEELYNITSATEYGQSGNVPPYRKSRRFMLRMAQVVAGLLTIMLICVPWNGKTSLDLTLGTGGVIAGVNLAFVITNAIVIVLHVQRVAFVQEECFYNIIGCVLHLISAGICVFLIAAPQLQYIIVLLLLLNQVATFAADLAMARQEAMNHAHLYYDRW